MEIVDYPRAVATFCLSDLSYSGHGPGVMEKPLKIIYSSPSFCGWEVEGQSSGMTPEATQLVSGRDGAQPLTWNLFFELLSSLLSSAKLYAHKLQDGAIFVSPAVLVSRTEWGSNTYV